MSIVMTYGMCSNKLVSYLPAWQTFMVKYVILCIYICIICILYI